MSQAKTEIEVSLQPWQLEVFRNRKRFTTISAGRQSGKTHLCVFMIFAEAFKKPRSICWWVAPTFDPAKVAFRRAINFLKDSGIEADINRSELRIVLPNESTITFKSADREDGLRGESVNFLVIDEMGLLKRSAWEFALQGTVTATKGEVVFIGTPKGKNLFWELYNMGLDRKEKDYASFHFNSKDSMFFGPKEWERVQRQPERIFRQEYCAEFLDDGGEVFRGVRECIKGELQGYQTKKTYYAGIDLAKSYDYTVLCILDENGHLVCFDRFNSVSWEIQKERLGNTIRKYHAYTLMDSTGIGDPILEDMQKYEVSVDGYKFTNISKRQLIESLCIAIERQEISFPEIPELINELNIYTFEQTEGGVIKYNAPDGMHDDIVIALALAWRAYSGGRFVEGLVDTGSDRVTAQMMF